MVPVVLWALGLRKPRAAGEQPESSCHSPVPSPALLGSAADLELLFPCPQQKDPETRLLLKTAALQWAPLLGPGVPARPVTLPGDSVPNSTALRLTGTASPSTRLMNVPAGHRGWGTAQQEMRPPRPPPSGRSRSGGGDGPRTSSSGSEESGVAKLREGAPSGGEHSEGQEGGPEQPPSGARARAGRGGAQAEGRAGKKA